MERPNNTIQYKNGGIKIMMKKLLTAVLTLGLIFSPVGNVVFHDQTTTVEAKSYKSGKRSFNTNNSNTNTNTNTNSFFQKKQTNNTTANTKSNRGFFSGGGLMRGLMIGGLAGLLFGGLFANMGILGSILGLIVNVLAIVILISVIRKIFVYFKKKKREEADNWRS